MTPRRHLEALDLAAVLAPFARSDGRIDASIEDDHGRCLATTTNGAKSETDGPGERATADIVVHGDRAGRVVLAGRTGDPALLQATADALASGLSVAVGAAIHRSRRGVRGRPRGRARPWSPAAAQLRVARAARRARLRRRELLRGGPRGRRRLLRPVPAAPAGPPTQPGDRRRHGQGHRGGVADGLLPSAAARRDRPHDQPGRCAGADEPHLRRGAADVTVHHGAVRPPRPAQRSPAVGQRRPRAAAVDPGRRVAGEPGPRVRGRCSGPSSGSSSRRSRSRSPPATRSCSTRTA